VPRSKGERVEPPGHVLDLHDIEKVMRALIRSAQLDVAHEAAVLAGKCRAGRRGRSCDRGEHICPGCGRAIWDCGRSYLINLHAALIGEGFVPGWHAKTCRACHGRQTIAYDGLCFNCYGFAIGAEIAKAQRAAATSS
jgi:hypothetical protein